MNEIALSVIAFSIVFLLIGVAGTYLRRISPVDEPLVVELVGWGSGILMLAWMGVIEVIEYALSDELLYSSVGVFLFGIVLNGVTLYLSIKVWQYYSPTWLIEEDQANENTATDASPAE
jgi:hypothetical protein